MTSVATAADLQALEKELLADIAVKDAAGFKALCDQAAAQIKKAA